MIMNDHNDWCYDSVIIIIVWKQYIAYVVKTFSSSFSDSGVHLNKNVKIYFSSFIAILFYFFCLCVGLSWLVFLGVFVCLFSST